MEFLNFVFTFTKIPAVLIRIFTALLLLTLAPATAPAQSVVSKPKPSFFIDGDVGALVILDDYGAGMTQASLAAGYRFSDRSALGLEHRRCLLGEHYYTHRAALLGPVYRYTGNGLYLRAAFGASVGGTYGEYGTLVDLSHKGLGTYQNLMLGYHFRCGILLGVSGTLVQRTFNRNYYELTPEYEALWQYEYYDLSELPEGAGTWREDGTEQHEFPVLTLTVGYAFPGRGKKFRAETEVDMRRILSGGR